MFAHIYKYTNILLPSKYVFGDKGWDSFGL